MTLPGTGPGTAFQPSSSKAWQSPSGVVRRVLARSARGGFWKKAFKMASASGPYHSRKPRAMGKLTEHFTLRAWAGSAKLALSGRWAAARRSTALTKPAALALRKARVRATDSLTAALTGTLSRYTAW